MNTTPHTDALCDALRQACAVAQLLEGAAMCAMHTPGTGTMSADTVADTAALLGQLLTIARATADAIDDDHVIVPMGSDAGRAYLVEETMRACA